jgi:hypothetical protein
MSRNTPHRILRARRRRSYAIWWTEGAGPRHAGKLELAPLHALLSGNGAGRLALAFDDIVGVDYSRGELTVARRNGPEVRIGNLDAPGVLLELGDALAA